MVVFKVPQKGLVIGHQMMENPMPCVLHLMAGTSQLIIVMVLIELTGQSDFNVLSTGLESQPYLGLSDMAYAPMARLVHR